jgi:hypothetical protein
MGCGNLILEKGVFNNCKSRLPRRANAQAIASLLAMTTTIIFALNLWQKIISSTPK